jgi:hypothetical protein
MNCVRVEMHDLSLSSRSGSGEGRRFVAIHVQVYFRIITPLGSEKMEINNK